MVREALDRVLDEARRPRSTHRGSRHRVSVASEDRAYRRGVKLDFIRPGKLTENAFIELFNRRLRDEYLNVHQFASIGDTQAKVQAWRLGYNQRRPHGSLVNLTPSEFVAQRQVTAKAAPV
jgi:putative transposase